MKQMEIDDFVEVDSSILEEVTEQEVITSLIKEFLAQHNTDDKTWNELGTQQQVILLSKGISGD